jgi:hypothetical protein
MASRSGKHGSRRFGIKNKSAATMDGAMVQQDIAKLLMMLNGPNKKHSAYMRP